MRDRKFGTEVVNVTQKVSNLNDLKILNPFTSNIEQLSHKEISAIGGNLSHTVTIDLAWNKQAKALLKSLTIQSKR